MMMIKIHQSVLSSTFIVIWAQLADADEIDELINVRLLLLLSASGVVVE